jgi:hypothetical protein
MDGSWFQQQYLVDSIEQRLRKHISDAACDLVVLQYSSRSATCVSAGFHIHVGITDHPGSS